jgi:hypothetical protein
MRSIGRVSCSPVLCQKLRDFVWQQRSEARLIRQQMRIEINQMANVRLLRGHNWENTVVIPLVCIVKNVQLVGQSQGASYQHCRHTI